MQENDQDTPAKKLSPEAIGIIILLCLVGLEACSTSVLALVQVINKSFAEVDLWFLNRGIYDAFLCLVTAVFAWIIKAPIRKRYIPFVISMLALVLLVIAFYLHVAYS